MSTCASFDNVIRTETVGNFLTKMDLNCLEEGLKTRREDAESPREKVQMLGILWILQAVGVFQSRVISDKDRI